MDIAWGFTLKKELQNCIIQDKTLQCILQFNLTLNLISLFSIEKRKNKELQLLSSEYSELC